MKIEVLDGRPDGRLEPLVGSYPFKPYREYRIMPRRRQEEVLRTEIDATLGHPDGRVFVAIDGGEPRAALVFRRLGWDTEFFGVAMGRIEYLLGAGDSERGGRGESAQDGVRESLRATVRACLDDCRERGVVHVAARVDIRDVPGIAVLEDEGFRLTDALVTYIYHPKREPPAAIKEMGVLRPFREEDTEQILEITREVYRGYRGRFHLDPHVPDERADEFYVEWARQCCNGSMADQIFVTESGKGEVHGFLGFRRREPVSSVGGTEVFGGGLGAVRRDRPGAYPGLIRAGTVWAIGRGAVAETQTQNYNFPTVRVYEAVGLQYVRADYTFHAWLGPQ